jgi:hypothetical protein
MKEKCEDFSKPEKPLKKKRSIKLKKFQLKGLGWCGEITAHKLTPEQIKQVKAHAEENGEDLKSLGGSMEDVIKNYNCYATNLWQTGMLPFLHATRYALVDSKNEIIYSIDKFENTQTGPKFEITETPEYLAERGKGNVLVFTEEHKGTTSVWEIESESTPSPKDFVFRLAKICVDSAETLYVDSVLYKGKELDRNYDEEMIVGKASYSTLL